MRGKFCASAVDKMFVQDSKTHPIFSIEPHKTDYADVAIASDLFTERLLKAINMSAQDSIYLGFVTEENLDALQTHAHFQWRMKNVLCQDEIVIQDLEILIVLHLISLFFFSSPT